jgi:alcohol dehydrogenase
MATHKAVHVASAGAALTLAEVETTPPPRDHVRIAVAACGVCGTDHAFVSGGFPGLSWPVTPGHEIAGTVAEVGDGVQDFAVGDRVEVGWFGGNCNRCVPCAKGYFMQCVRLQIPSWHYPGGYAESVTVPATALARIPDGLSFVEAAPLGCAGVTTDHLPISPLDLINAGLSVTGHPSGTARDVDETMQFALQTGVRAVVQERSLAQAAEAYEAMETGKARYRMVLVN